VYENNVILRTNDRPTDLAFGHISAADHPIDFAFDPRVGFSGAADRMDLLPVSPNPRWRLAAILGGWPPSWKISNDNIYGMSYPIDPLS